MKKPSSEKGTTLLELAIVSGLLLFISVGMLMVLTGAIRYYHQTNATIEAQQGVLFGLSHISQELGESHRDSVTILPAGRGILFASPRDPGGNFQFDTFGRLLWQKYIVYYLDKVNESGTEIPIMVRKEVLFSDLGGAPTSVPVRSTLSLADLLLKPGNSRVAGRYVSVFEAKEATEVIEESGLSEAFGSRVIQIRIEAKTVYRDEFSVEGETSILLRN